MRLWRIFFTTAARVTTIGVDVEVGVRDVFPFCEGQTSAVQIPAPPRSNAASIGQNPSPGPPARLDYRDRFGDEIPRLHPHPKYLSQIRSNEDRILRHDNTHPISVVITARSQGTVTETAQALCGTFSGRLGFPLLGAGCATLSLW